MLKKIWLVSLSFICSWACTPAQKLVAEADSSSQAAALTIKGNISLLTADHLGNMYALRNNDELIKLSARGDSLGVYNQQKNFGSPSSIDVSNPMNILLFYKSFGTIVLLDRFLSIQSVIDLRKNNNWQISAAAMAYNNGIWLFDEIENRVLKINKNGDLLSTTPDFRNAIGEALQVTEMADNNRNLYLVDTLRGMYIFDYFGNLQRKMELPDWQNLHFNFPYLSGNNADTLFHLQVNTEKITSYKVPHAYVGDKAFSITPLLWGYRKKEGVEIRRMEK